MMLELVDELGGKSCNVTHRNQMSSDVSGDDVGMSQPARQHSVNLQRHTTGSVKRLRLSPAKNSVTFAPSGPACSQILPEQQIQPRFALESQFVALLLVFPEHLLQAHLRLQDLRMIQLKYTNNLSK